MNSRVFDIGKKSVKYKGRKYTRYQAGFSPREKEARLDGDLDPHEVFCECGKEEGQYHDLGCDLEQCPVCKSQPLSCEHGDLFETKTAKCR